MVAEEQAEIMVPELAVDVVFWELVIIPVVPGHRPLQVRMEMLEQVELLELPVLRVLLSEDILFRVVPVAWVETERMAAVVVVVVAVVADSKMVTTKLEEAEVVVEVVGKAV